MTNFEVFAAAVCVIVVVFIGVWCLYVLMELSNKARTQQEELKDECPYKVEGADPQHPAEDLMISDNPHNPAGTWTYNYPVKAKRKYTKKSKYWGSAKHKAKLKKAHQARRNKSAARKIK